MAKPFKLIIFVLWFLVKISPMGCCQKQVQALSDKFQSSSMPLPCQKGKNRADDICVLFIEEDQEQPPKEEEVQQKFTDFLSVSPQIFLGNSTKLFIQQHLFIAAFQHLHKRNCVWLN